MQGTKIAPLRQVFFFNMFVHKCAFSAGFAREILHAVVWMSDIPEASTVHLRQADSALSFLLSASCCVTIAALHLLISLMLC